MCRKEETHIKVVKYNDKRLSITHKIFNYIPNNNNNNDSVLMYEM